MSGARASWSLHGLSHRYAGAEHDALHDVTVEIPAGECTAVIGPNGAGKSTLLHLLLGTLRPTSGSVRYAGAEVPSWDRRRFAREVGVVSQSEDAPFPMTVRELVAMGRYPHLGPWRREGEADRRAIADAMVQCDVIHLGDRPLSTLSGGERQRARLARALAQQPRALVLDEPTAALDVQHEMTMFELLATLSAAGATVLVVTHQLNLAARFAHRLLLLDRGRVAAEGDARTVLTGDRVARVYGWPVTIQAHPGPGPDAGVPQVVPLRDASAAIAASRAGAAALP